METKPRPEAEALLGSDKEEFNRHGALVCTSDGGYDVIRNSFNYLPLPTNRFAPRWAF